VTRPLLATELSDARDLLYRAIESTCGIIISTTDPERAITILGKARSQSEDEQLGILQFSVLQSGEVGILKRGPKVKGEAEASDMAVTTDQDFD
jgi:hypothetical protein